MQLVAVGLNQSSAPLSVRERVAFVPERMRDALARLAGEVHEGVILSTCNRTELYAIAGHTASGADTLKQFLHRWHGIPEGALDGHLYSLSHAAAARHLFRVTAGLDSMVLGEDQIVAQVKAAFAQAHAAGVLGPRLHRLGAAALAASKRVRAETGIARSATSVVSVALETARSELGCLDGRSVAVIGAGRTAEVVVRHTLALAPSAAVTVMNRTAPRGAELARRCGVQSAPFSELPRHAAGADLLVSATSAPCIVVGRGDLAGPRERRLVCLDLAVPRDIDPAAASIPQVTIHHIDHLRGLAAENRRRREAEVAPAEAIVDESVERFEEWWRAREVAPTITRLRARAESIRDAELERALSRLPGLAAAEQAVVRDLAGRLINKLLHQPMTTLKHDPEGANLATALDRLFLPTDS